VNDVDESLVTIGEVVKIGRDLKLELERLARAQNGDAAWLARRVLREYVAGQAVSSEPGPRVGCR
jgi:hypothetical protein